MEQDDALKRMNEVVFEQLEFAENKHEIVIGITTALLTAEIGLIATEWSTITGGYGQGWFWWFLGWLCHVGLTLLVALGTSLWAVFPKLGKDPSDKQDLNPFYFGDIAQMNGPEDYEKALKNGPVESLECENIMVSKIIERKLFLLQIAILFLAGAICPLLPLLLFALKKIKKSKD